MKYKTYLSILISIVSAKQQFLILMAQLTYTLIYDSVNTSDRPEYKTVDVTDTNLEKITTQSNFKYYQNHDFHKLAQGMNSKKSFSIIHTNICSLHAKQQHLELLIADLDHTFDIIGVSKTWTPEIT